MAKLTGCWLMWNPNPPGSWQPQQQRVPRHGGGGPHHRRRQRRRHHRCHAARRGAHAAGGGAATGTGVVAFHVLRTHFRVLRRVLRPHAHSRTNVWVPGPVVPLTC